LTLDNEIIKYSSHIIRKKTSKKNTGDKLQELSKCSLFKIIENIENLGLQKAINGSYLRDKPTCGMDGFPF
jgi:hypothetical protein